MVNWFNPPLQKKVAYRAGDTIIAVPAKSGTTWTMNIFHQLRTGGDANFQDIYAEVPWPEFKERPDQPDQELIDRWAALPTNVPRAFKTHCWEPHCPKGGRHIVCMRDPADVAVSFYHFFEDWLFPRGADTAA